jgi:hypothetical protein
MPSTITLNYSRLKGEMFFVFVFVCCLLFIVVKHIEQSGILRLQAEDNIEIVNNTFHQTLTHPTLHPLHHTTPHLPQVRAQNNRDLDRPTP